MIRRNAEGRHREVPWAMLVIGMAGWVASLAALVLAVWSARVPLIAAQALTVVAAVTTATWLVRRLEPTTSVLRLLPWSVHARGSVAMRRALYSPMVLPLVLLSIGCSSQLDQTKTAAEKTKTAVEHVLKADEKLAKEREHLPPKATPSQIAWSIGVYCSGLEQLAMSDCPADFRVAYKQHLRAWRDTQAAVQQLPDSFLEGVFVGFFNSLLRGEIDGGSSRLEGDLKRALERVRTTWEEVERIGAKYGAAL